MYADTITRSMQAAIDETCGMNAGERCDWSHTF
jgi:excinuclease UvrABC helicase subunit UvrB